MQKTLYGARAAFAVLAVLVIGLTNSFGARKVDLNDSPHLARRAVLVGAQLAIRSIPHFALKTSVAEILVKIAEDEDEESKTRGEAIMALTFIAPDQKQKTIAVLKTLLK